MKVLYGFLIIVFLNFQFQLWLGEDSVRELNMLQTELDAQRQINAEIEERNRLLEIEVVELKTGLEAVEERARSELGMIEKGETFYLLLD
ncbi:MAG: septum formation initiator family protein [Pseudomonadota bacterium]|jgi:cell division protein FtsB|nr:septum formation initiator family protein [Pseudomonadales bacterium]MEE3289887.1 septum formation initiator family protein [Pseudomonadota bacterium]GIT22617.1 MAG: cell division protein FtsB [Gammaproteobacteria bacterium]